MGFTVAGKRVTGIGLYSCDLKIFPKAITNLKSLKQLILARNNISTLPKSISNLTSLE